MTILSVFADQSSKRNSNFTKKLGETKKAITNALKTNTMQKKFKHSAAYKVELYGPARPFSHSHYFWVGQKAKILNQPKIKALVDDKIKYQFTKLGWQKGKNYKKGRRDHVSEVEITETSGNKKCTDNMVKEMKKNGTKFKNFLDRFNFSSTCEARLTLYETNRGRIVRVLGHFKSDGTFY